MKVSIVFANLAQTMAGDHVFVTNLTTAKITLTEQVVMYNNRLSTKEDDNVALHTTIKNL